MRENMGWSSSVGYWFGMPVRAHCFLYLFLALILGLELTLLGSADEVGPGTSVVTIVLLLVFVVVHELAHLFTTVNLGGHVNKIVLMPWGGSSDYYLTVSAKSRLAVHAAGPIANGLLFLMGGVLLVQSGNAAWIDLTNPFRPQEFDLSVWQVSILKIATWINCQLFLVNLIPCFPFDGAALVRSLVESMNDSVPQFRRESGIKVLGHAVAFALIGLSLLIRDYQLGPIGPAWMIMGLAGIGLFFAAQYSHLSEIEDGGSEWVDDLESDYPAYFDDFGAGDLDSESLYSEERTSDRYFLPDSTELDYSQWLSEKQERRLLERRQLEQEEKHLADAILTKLHEEGIESLSEEDRRLLDRVSAQLRRERGQSV